MGHEDNKEALAKIFQAARIVSIATILVNIYYFLHGPLQHLGITHGVIDTILLRVQDQYGLFSTTLPTKGIALLFLFASSLAERGKPADNVEGTRVATTLALGLAMLAGSGIALRMPWSNTSVAVLYAVTTTAGFLLVMHALAMLARIIGNQMRLDPFNVENESFPQQQQLVYHEHSVNLPTKFYYRKRWNDGWINVVNPFRATLVLGTPGSGKSFAVINPFIKQLIEKGFAMYLYDFKFPDLSEIAYNHLRLYGYQYQVPPKFYVINFDDPSRTHRCNPIHPAFLTDIMDAYEAAYIILVNLNRKWAQQQGDFFVESPITMLASIIWFLRIYSPDGSKERQGEYCTFPHAIELLNQPYTQLFPVLAARRELANYMSAFMNAWQGGAQDQLQGQIASAQIPLSRISSPGLYWAMSGDDFTLDLNNPQEPKILCMGNNPGRQNIYGAALGLYNSRIVKNINQKGRIPTALIVDELPTIYFKGLDNLIATARSNRVAVCLGVQDFSQLRAEYGDKEADKIINTIGNVFSGQVKGNSAKTLSEGFGKVMQRRESISRSDSGQSSSVSSQMDSLIPASKIANLPQGTFVGSTVEEFNQDPNAPIQPPRIFHARIQVDAKRIAHDTARYEPIPRICPFPNPRGEHDEEIMREVVQGNYDMIKQQVVDLVSREVERIRKDPRLKHLLIGESKQ